MEYIIFLYAFFTGCIYTAWLYDEKDSFGTKFFAILAGFMNGWLAAPIIIGRAIKQIY